MISGVGAALSGLQLYSKKLSVSANNIANANTDGFKKSRAVATQTQSGVVQAEISKVNTPGVPYLSPDGAQVRESSNVNYAEEMVETMISKAGFQANIKSILAQDEVTEALLDILA